MSLTYNRLSVIEMLSKVIGSSSLLEDGKKDTEIVQDEEGKNVSYLVYITTV